MEIIGIGKAKQARVSPSRVHKNNWGRKVVTAVKQNMTNTVDALRENKRSAASVYYPGFTERDDPVGFENMRVWQLANAR